MNLMRDAEVVKNQLLTKKMVFLI